MSSREICTHIVESGEINTIALTYTNPITIEHFHSYGNHLIVVRSTLNPLVQRPRKKWLRYQADKLARHTVFGPDENSLQNVAVPVRSKPHIRRSRTPSQHNGVAKTAGNQLHCWINLWQPMKNHRPG